MKNNCSECRYCFEVNFFIGKYKCLKLDFVSTGPEENRCFKFEPKETIKIKKQEEENDYV